MTQELAQQSAVALILALAALFLLLRWLPARLRRRLARHHPALAKPTGCGACSSCSGCAAPQPQASTARPVRMPPGKS